MTGVLFGDTASLVIDGLTDLGYDASGRVPSPRPDTFVTVMRVGGVKRDQVLDDPTLVIECWAPTPTAAHDLCMAVRSDLPGLAGLKRVRESAGPAELPDPLSEQPRYSMTVEVTVRGTTTTGS